MINNILWPLIIILCDMTPLHTTDKQYGIYHAQLLNWGSLKSQVDTTKFILVFHHHDQITIFDTKIRVLVMGSDAMMLWYTRVKQL